MDKLLLYVSFVIQSFIGDQAVKISTGVIILIVGGLVALGILILFVVVLSRNKRGLSLTQLPDPEPLEPYTYSTVQKSGGTFSLNESSNNEISTVSNTMAEGGEGYVYSTVQKCGKSSNDPPSGVTQLDIPSNQPPRSCSLGRNEYQPLVNEYPDSENKYKTLPMSDPLPPSPFYGSQDSEALSATSFSREKSVKVSDSSIHPIQTGYEMVELI